ncbi:hypothetical protein [Streptomyces olivaceus]|uniref:hypothetical protein n=1 Tax=Streptomyces olivaceus TaxID=47716 RepID=UPI0040579C2C
MRVFDVGERGSLRSADVVAVMGPGALDAIQADVAPGKAADPLMEPGVVPCRDGRVVSPAFVQVGGVVVRGVGGDDGTGQIGAVQERG